MRRVLVIGMDGATPELMEPWMEAGYLPHIAALVSDGVWGNLESVIHPHSPPAWTSFLTGQNPGKHGVYEFSQREPGTYRWRVTSSQDRKSPAIWELLGKDQRSAFYFVPMTYPPNPLNGVMVSGLGTPGLQSDFTYPIDLKNEILNEFRRETILEPAATEEDPYRYLQLVWKSIEDQTGIALKFTPQETDLTVLVFGQTDRVQHFFWHQMELGNQGHPSEYGDAILKTYRKIDAQIGRLIDEVDEDTTVMLLSDHGMGAYRRELYLNNWLFKHGLLKYTDNVETFGGRILTGTIAAVRKRARGRVRDLFRLLRRQGWLGKLDSSLRNPLASRIDWSRTKAYSFGYLGNIYLNLRGREPEGIVEPGAEARKVLEELEYHLNALSDPETGEKVVTTVYHKDQVFHGEALGGAPDLVLECHDDFYATGEPFYPYDVVFTSEHKVRTSRFPHTARHRLQGIFAARGPTVRRGTPLQGAHLLDIAPTLLYLLGQPIPADLDGRCLLEMIEPGYLASNPPHYAEQATMYQQKSAITGLSQEEESLVEAHLRSLGYLE